MLLYRGRSGILNPLREKCHRIVVNNAGICSSFYFEDKYQWQPSRRIKRCFRQFKFDKNDFLKKCPKVQYRNLDAYIGPPVLVYWTGLSNADIA